MKDKKLKSESRLLSNISLISVFVLIAVAIVADLIIFSNVVLQFVAALIVPCIAFVILFAAMIASFIFIFGIFLVEQYGFWPLTLSVQFFDEIIGDIEVTASQVEAFRTLRIVLIVLCIVIFVLSIVGATLAKNDKEEGNDAAYRSSKGKCKAARVFSILGILVSVGALAITSAI